MIDSMLRPREVVERTGLSRVTIWRRVRAGKFPPPVILGEHAIGWPNSVITDWLDAQPRGTPPQKQWLKEANGDTKQVSSPEAA